MMLYEEESKGLDGREDVYKMARALSRDLSPVWPKITISELK